MLERLRSEREAGSAAMASLHSGVTRLTPMEFSLMKDCLGVLGPFNEATIELLKKRGCQPQR